MKVAALSAASMFAASAHGPEAWAAKGKRATSYKIVYKLNGGTNPAGQVRRVKRGKAIAVGKLMKPRKAGYVFCGWYADRSLSTRAVKVRGRADSAGRRIFAKWEPTYYPIFFELHGGDNPANQVVRVKRNKKVSVKKLKKPKRKGYSFGGWFLDSKLSEPASSVSGKPDAAKRRVHAGWQLTSYMIKYKMSGGRELIALPQSYTIETPTFKFYRPIRDGFYFTGWYSDSDLSEPIEKVAKGSTGKKTLYAGWSAVDYWDKHLLAQCASVNSIAAEAGSSAASFVFITDMHLASNALVSPYLVKRVMAATPASMVVFGGDALNFHTVRSNAVDLLGSMRTMFGDAEFHFVRGNHDGNSYNTAATAELEISDAEVLSLTASGNEVRDPGCLYYYRDDDARKIRYVFLDSGTARTPQLDTAQGLWLRKRILELEGGWTAVVIVHRFFAAQAGIPDIFLPQLDSFGVDLVAALDEVYEQADAVVAGVICGHCHRDYYEQPSAKGYPYFAVATTCDAYGKVEGDPVRARLLGSEDEQAFDVVTIDTANKLVHLTRIGWGHDRCYSYAPEEPLPPAANDGDGEDPAGESSLRAASGSW